MEQVSFLVVAAVSSLLLEGAKRIQSIPLNSGQKARLRVVLGVLVFSGSLLSAFLGGNLEQFIASDQIKLLIESGTAYVVAHYGYKFLKLFKA